MTADATASRTAARRGVPTLPAHLSDTYGIEVTEIAQLDLGVYRVDRADGGSWVARLFPAVRPREHVDGDAEILRWLAALDYPADPRARGRHRRPGARCVRGRVAQARSSRPRSSIGASVRAASSRPGSGSASRRLRLHSTDMAAPSL